MSQEVLCPNPSCGKKYRIKGEVPAEFTCTKCGQAMDLSAFAPPPTRGAAPSTRGARRGGAVRRTRAREEPEEEEEGRPRFQTPPKNNAALLWGSLAGLVIAVVLVILVMGGKDKGQEPAPGTGPSALPTPSGVPLAGATPGIPAPPVEIRVPTPADGGTPGPAAPPPRRGSALTALKVWDPPAEVGITADEKERIERALDTALNDTGRAVQEAQGVLIGLGRKAIWRLVSEFKHIQDTDTFEKRQGLIRAMIVDRILRSIDGYMERHAKVMDRINPESSPDWATNVAKRWNGWLERGSYTTELKAWDPRVDEQDEGAERPASRRGGAGGAGGER